MTSFGRKAFGSSAGVQPEMQLDRSTNAMRVGIPPSHYVNKNAQSLGVKITELNPVWQARYGTQHESRSSGLGQYNLGSVTSQQTVDSVLGQQVDGNQTGMLQRLIEQVRESESGRPQRKVRKQAGEPFKFDASQVSEMTPATENNYGQRFGQFRQQMVETQPAAQNMRDGNPTAGYAPFQRNPGQGQLSFVDNNTGVITAQPPQGRTVYNPLNNSVEVRVGQGPLTNAVRPPGQSQITPAQQQLINSFYNM